MPPVLKSPVWKFFEPAANDNTQAKCKICSFLITRGGKTAKSFTTSNLSNHLKKKHPTQYGDISKVNPSNNLLTSPTNIDDSDEPSSSNLVKFETVKTNLQQLTLPKMVEKRKLWDINDSRAKRIHFNIGEMIATDLQPFSIVEDIGFQRLLKGLEPCYKIPSRKFFSENIVPHIYEGCVQKLKALINEVSSVSFTTDLWTAQDSNEPFLSLTAHWLNEDFHHRMAVLKATHFPGSHNAAAICSAIKNMLQDWNIEEEKVVAIVHDNGANITKGIADTSLPHLPCFIHTLQLVINDAIFSQRVVSDILAIARHIVGHFKHSSLACGKIKDIQTQLGLSQLKLIQDVPTRWNSTYLMLQRLYEQRRAVTFYGSENAISSLTSDQWSIVDKVLYLLQPFEEITKEASKDKESSAIIIPFTRTLENYFNKQENDKGVQTMKAELLKAMKERFPVSELENKKLYVLATCLDPRFKTLFFRSPETKPLAKQWLLEEFKNKEPDSADDEYPIPCTSKSDETSEKAHKKQRSLTFWSCFDEMSSNPVNKNVIGTTKGKVALEREIDEYFSQHTIPRDNDPLKWWINHKPTYPNLAKVSTRFLSTPPSSVASERMFSSAGDICEGNRSRLLPDKTDQILFLHCNLAKLNFSY